MPGSNNFLVFNPTDAANTQDDATYAAEMQRTTGLQNGIAKTAMHNKLFRQLSVMVAAIAQYMADQGQTVSDTDVSALTTVIRDSFMQRGATVLDTGTDASTYVWQNGVYSCTANVANMPVAGKSWIVVASVSDFNNMYLYAVDVTAANNFYVRQKIAGVWQAWVSQAFALQSDLDAHLAEKATEAELGHVIIGTGLDVDVNGVVRVETDTAKFKKGSSTFTDNDTSQTFTDAFCTANSLVTIVITSATSPQGVWSVESGAGSFTITSTIAESADITFDYYIQKAVG